MPGFRAEGEEVRAKGKGGKGKGMHDVHGRELRWKGCTMCMEGSCAGRRDSSSAKKSGGLRRRPEWNEGMTESDKESV